MEINSEEISVGTYVVCKWYPEHGVAYVDAHDLDKFMALSPGGKVFKCIVVEGVWLRLQYGDNEYKVNGVICDPIHAVQFDIGECVNAIEKIGTIVEINWHFKNSEPLYFLEFGGKRSSRRYLENELALLPCSISEQHIFSTRR